MAAAEGGQRGRRALRIVAIAVACVVLLLVAAAAVTFGAMRASLPQLDGAARLPGLERPVVVERDERGIPSLMGETRLDLVVATGFVHAQERLFQMDLLRRRAAGELSGLFGAATLDADRAARRHGLRAGAREAFARASAAERATLEAYAHGVNAGAASLAARPPEYLLLRTRFAPWQPEDTILVVHAMYFLLQGDDGLRERVLGAMSETMSPELFRFLSVDGTPWDAPLDGGARRLPAVPAAAAIGAPASAPRAPPPAAGSAPAAHAGSNGFALAGTRSAHGGAIVASDMHLPLGLPNTWYRLVLSWREGGTPRRVVGLTLPGTPTVVVGSNGDLAWGFTNSYGDWSDVVLVEPDPADPGRYLVPGGSERFEERTSTIHVLRGKDEEVEARWTRWGPVVGEDGAGRTLALRWIAHRPGAVSLDPGGLERARSIEDAFEVAERTGIPAQNLVVGEAGGRVGWTIMGPIPRRLGCGESRLPMRGATSGCRWDGLLDPSEYPRLADHPVGAVWTANNRIVDGDALALIGDGGYAHGARARQIRDALVELDGAEERDLLAVQLDDRARVLDAWQARLVEAASEAWQAGDPARREFRALVDAWGGRASTGSAGYRFVRAFRGEVADALLGPWFEACRAIEPACAPARLTQRHGPVEALLEGRPQHFLPDGVQSYDALLEGAATRVFDHFAGRGVRLAERTWGERNTVRLAHPLSRALPPLARLLALPPRQLPGDMIVPRVQSPRFGASERMIVAPGREESGILHMPGGQSGHPLSSWFGDATEAWAAGRPEPLMPGEAVHRLVLEPAPR